MYVSKMYHPDCVDKLAVAFNEEIVTSQPGDPATIKWETLRDTMHRTALATFGKKTSKSHDWFQANSDVTTPVFEAKRVALAEYKRLPIIRAARGKAQQSARHCTNEYWTELSDNIQRVATTGTIRGMYDGIKKALGPVQSKTAPLKSSTGEVITDKGQQMEIWVEHYSLGP